MTENTITQAPEKNEQENFAKIENDVPADLMKTYYFGCGPCHPKWLQFLFARKKFFTFLMCSFGFLEAGIISGLVSTVLSTIEKRYNFSSLAAGLIAIVFDATVLIGVIFISYFGSKTHRPRVLGSAALIMSFGTALFAMPQFFFGEYMPSEGGDLLQEECLDERNAVKLCDSSNNISYAIFLISNIIIAIGAIPLYTLGMAYLDEIVYPRYVSLHIGIFSMSFVVGPLLGYAIGSAFLLIYVDPWKITTLTPSDPAWVGAWWMAFVLFAFLLLLLGIFFLMYPRYLSDSYLVREERIKEMARVYSSKYANEDTLTITVKMFPIHMKRLLLNPSFILMTVGFSVSYLFLEGVIVFAPQFIEVQFNLIASTAGLVVGAITIPGGSTLFGAILVFGCKMKGQINALYVAIFTGIVVPILLVFLLHCPERNVVGITTPHVNGLLLSDCAESCNCTSSLFDPVCGADSLNYFSPCKSGCAKSIGENGSVLFENCTCVAQSLYNNSMDFVNATATSGYCSSECFLLAPALVGWAVLSFFGFASQIPFIHFTLRVVADDQRALALGIQSAVLRVVGAIPGPLVFGALFDYACLSWHVECGQLGNCWIYNKDQLSYSAIGVGIPCNMIASLCFFLAWLVYPKQKVDEKEKLEEVSS